MLVRVYAVIFYDFDPCFLYLFTMVKLFVSGFPADASELEIVQLFDPFGKVMTIKIVIDKVTRKRKGYAFLEMEDMASAQAAIRELYGTAWGEHGLTVNFATEKQHQPQL